MASRLKFISDTTKKEHGKNVLIEAKRNQGCSGKKQKLQKNSFNASLREWRCRGSAGFCRHCCCCNHLLEKMWRNIMIKSMPQSD